jgi:ferredoxin
MQPNRPIAPSTLSVKDLPWQIEWHKDKCTLCGRCTAVCPVNAIELGVFRKRRITVSLDPGNPPASYRGLPRHSPENRSGLCLRGLRHVQPGLPQRCHLSPAFRRGG